MLIDVAEKVVQGVMVAAGKMWVMVGVGNPNVEHWWIKRESERGKEGRARVKGTEGECGTLLLSFLVR